MKILAIHNFHRSGSASGDDQVFKSETSMLEEHGHEVIRYTVSNDEFDKADAAGKLAATFGMLWSFKNYRAVVSLIREHHPDLVHVHTFFPLLSPSILYAAKRMGVPVVATLHDTRFVCPVATSLRDGKICNECGDGHYLRMTRHACFKGSRLQSLLVAGIFKYHRARRSFYKQIDRYICLNENQIDLLKDIGFDSSKIVKKYNFVPDAQANMAAERVSGLPERYAVFYGRIGAEKGIRVLQRIWNEIDDIPLVVMGGGPLEDDFKAWADKKPNVYFLGYTPHEQCMAIAKAGEFVVFPSIWYEGCSMVEIESESLGLPLIATDLGFSAEAVNAGVNGVKVPLGDMHGWVTAIRGLWKEPELCKKMGMNARRDYEDKYTPENNYQQLINIYQSTLERG